MINISNLVELNDIYAHSAIRSAAIEHKGQDEFFKELSGFIDY